MQKGKLIQILRGLSPRECNRFAKYVQSPFFNRHKEVTALADYILRYAPHFDNPSLQKDLIMSFLSKENAAISETHFYNLSSYLLELLCDFLAYLEQEQHKMEQKLYTLRALRKRNMEKQFVATARRHQQLQKRENQQNTNLYYQQFLFYSELDYKFLAQPRRQYDENLQLRSNHLDLFYLSSKLKMACDMASRNIIIKANYDCQLIEELLSYLNKYPDRYKDQPSIGIYSQVLKMLTSEEEQDYFELKENLAKYIPHFSAEEAQLIFDYAQNYCIRKINSGQTNYYQEFLNLYKLQLKTGTLLRRGILDQWDYKNIVTTGLRLKDYEWTEQFIHQNKGRLKKDLRENAYVYNLAAFYYATRQYTEALRSLHRVEFTDITYHLGAKIIQLKSYYELEETEPFHALINTFQIYVKRSKQLSAYRKEAYFNFLKIAKKLGVLKEKHFYLSKKQFEKERMALQAQINATQTLANSDWIEEVFSQF